jgi:hypothetical protein
MPSKIDATQRRQFREAAHAAVLSRREVQYVLERAVGVSRYADVPLDKFADALAAIEEIPAPVYGAAR